MSSGTQVDLDWNGMEAAAGGAGAPPAGGANGAGAGAALTDEEILGIDSPSPNSGFDVGARHAVPLQPASSSGGLSVQQAGGPAPAMPEWMQGVAGDPKHAAEAQQLWQEHQAFRAAFSSPEEARAIKEMFPGGAQEALALREAAQEVESLREAAAENESLRQGAESLRQAAQAVEQIDAAIYSGDARAQSEVVAELARANPAAFRAMFAEAAKVLAGMGGTGGGEAGGTRQEARNYDGPTLRKRGEGWGTQPTPAINAMPPRRQDAGATSSDTSHPSHALRASGSRVTNHPLPGTGHSSAVTGHLSSVTNDESPSIGHSSHAAGAHAPRRQDAGATSADTNHESRVTHHDSRVTNDPSPGIGQSSTVTGHQSPVTSHQSPHFDPAAYAAFERSTNDAVARDVRSTVGETLARVLPEGIAEGAARRIGEDIFNEIHRALAADRSLAEQVGEVLRGSPGEFAAGGWRFGMAEQHRVASLLAGRARQIVPGVARRVVGEWTSSVLGASRSKAARQAAAASRVDIAAPGGSLDSMPLRPMSRRDVNYAAMSDDQILGM